MYYRTIRNDIQRNKAITLAIMFFVAAAAMLVSLAAILVVNLSGAIDAMMTRAKTPHFMQMHTGDLDFERLESFIGQRSEIVIAFGGGGFDGQGEISAAEAGTFLTKIFFCQGVLRD